jgi:hypothetical protein
MNKRLKPLHNKLCQRLYLMLLSLKLLATRYINQNMLRLSSNSQLYK